MADESISEIKLILREGIDGHLGVEIWDSTDQNGPLSLIAAGLISELQNNPDRILASGDAAFQLAKIPYEKGLS